MAVNANLNTQEALYRVLTNDSTLMSLVSGVYDFVPENVSGTYITIGDDEFEPWDTMGTRGSIVTHEIHIFDEGSRGRATVKKVMRQLYNTLHYGSITISGYDHIGTQFEFEASYQEEDGLTYHGVQRYKTYLHSNGSSGLSAFTTEFTSEFF